MKAPFKLPLRAGTGIEKDVIFDVDGNLVLGTYCDMCRDSDVGAEHPNASPVGGYIVRAVNAHDDLLAACEEALALLKTMTVQGFKAGADQDTRARLARAIEKARGQS
jgi:hypothetical protein